MGDNPVMNWNFTKMHGAGNDFVVLDGVRQTIEMTPERARALGDRHFGIGADQILLVERATRPDADFRYRIFNSDGSEVEHCGNGARCFVRYARDHGLTTQDAIRVETLNRVLELKLQPDGRVSVDMQAPVFDHAALPFDSSALTPRVVNGFELWPLELRDRRAVEVAVLSMGNPHAVQRVDDVATAPVVELGSLIEQHPRFPRKVNAGFMQVMSRTQIALRVFERGAGETLACGTGACAAVVAGIRLGWLDATVDVQTRGGVLTIEWAGDGASVLMTGPAQTVYEGEIEI
jgi:diaminopimelate epimerase